PVHCPYLLRRRGLAHGGWNVKEKSSSAFTGAHTCPMSGMIGTGRRRTTDEASLVCAPIRWAGPSSHPAAALLVRRRRAYRHDGHGRDELLAGAGRVEVGADLALADLEQTEAERAAVGRLHAVLGADLELQAGRQALARHGAHQLGPPGAVGLLGRDAELARLPGLHAADALLERGEELPSPDQDRDGPAASGRVDEPATRQAHGVLERD